MVAAHPAPLIRSRYLRQFFLRGSLYPITKDYMYVYICFISFTKPTYVLLVILNPYMFYILITLKLFKLTLHPLFALAYTLPFSSANPCTTYLLLTLNKAYSFHQEHQTFCAM